MKTIQTFLFEAAQLTTVDNLISRIAYACEFNWRKDKDLLNYIKKWLKKYNVQDIEILINKEMARTMKEDGANMKYFTVNNKRYDSIDFDSNRSKFLLITDDDFQLDTNQDGFIVQLGYQGEDPMYILAKQ